MLSSPSSFYPLTRCSPEAAMSPGQEPPRRVRPVWALRHCSLRTRVQREHRLVAWRPRAAATRQRPAGWVQYSSAAQTGQRRVPMGAAAAAGTAEARASQSGLHKRRVPLSPGPSPRPPSRRGLRPRPLPEAQPVAGTRPVSGRVSPPCPAHSAIARARLQPGAAGQGEQHLPQDLRAPQLRPAASSAVPHAVEAFPPRPPLRPDQL